MGNGHLPAAHVPPDPGILLNYKKGEESWGFSVMEMRLARHVAAWKPDSGYWIMADFRDETHQWRCVSRGPQQPPWKVHTKKGQNSAVMEVMEAMEIQCSSATLAGLRRKAIAVMGEEAMDNGEAACPPASRARKTGQTSI